MGNNLEVAAKNYIQAIINSEAAKIKKRQMMMLCMGYTELYDQAAWVLAERAALQELKRLVVERFGELQADAEYVLTEEQIKRLSNWSREE